MTLDESSQKLNNSEDPRDVKKAAAALAASEKPVDQDFLLRQLSSGAFLSRLDSAEAYKGTASEIRLAYVMDTLSRNSSKVAWQTVTALTVAPEYNGNVLRMILLIQALAQIRPSPPEVIRYWNDKSKLDSPLASDVITALCVNQSEPALALLEQKFAQDGHKDTLKVFWMRNDILPRRNDLPLVACCERLLTGSLPLDLRPALVEALFDYKPSSWYRGCSPPKPPSRLLASDDVKVILQRIGENALQSIPLSEGQRASVRYGLAELGVDAVQE